MDKKDEHQFIRDGTPAQKFSAEQTQKFARESLPNTNGLKRMKKLRRVRDTPVHRRFLETAGLRVERNTATASQKCHKSSGV